MSKTLQSSLITEPHLLDVVDDEWMQDVLANDSVPLPEGVQPAQRGKRRAARGGRGAGQGAREVAGPRPPVPALRQQYRCELRTVLRAGQMDADELLARQLQAEEDRAAARAHQPTASHSQAAALQGFQARLHTGMQTVLRYEDETLQALALSLIPEEQLREKARQSMAEAAPAAEEDAFVRQLLAWFKRDFFTWVNNPPCERCGCKETAASGMSAPTADEAAGGAGRVELYACPGCAATTRFPRYNNPGRLLQTRSGRCGEWANAFCLCARACGLDTRWVLDLTDHVWAEYYSAAQRRWVHLDPCEDAYDQPLLYEAGWGKKLTYVLGFSKAGVRDITRRYTQRMADLLPRRNEVPERWLAGACLAVTQRMRSQVSAPARQLLEARDGEEDAELSAEQGKPETPEEEALPGRQTGSVQWRAARGELGNGAAVAPTEDPLQASLVAKDTTEPASGALPQETPARQAAQGTEQAPAAPKKAAAQSHVAAAESLGRRFKERFELSPRKVVADPKEQLALRVKQHFGELMAEGKLLPNEAAAQALKWAAAEQQN